MRIADSQYWTRIGNRQLAIGNANACVAFGFGGSYDAQADAKPNFARCAMKFPGGFNIQQMMKQAQVMQDKMQKEMEELRTEASSGGGVVTVEMKGNHEIVSLKIDPEAVKEGDVEMLQDMILAAINEANRKVDEAMKGKLGGMLPPGLGGLLG
jgi:DNA-binding YbaB/EbfC family protein